MQSTTFPKMITAPSGRAYAKGDNYTLNNRVFLVWSGKDFFSLFLRLLENAARSIHLQTYIFKDDSTGNVIADALMRAAARGVQVYLLVDGYASQGLSAGLKDRLVNSGVHFRWFEPLFRSHHFYVGRRLHHKVAVVDGRYGLVGGINIADRYNDVPGDPAWLDAALLVEGEVCAKLSEICCSTWNGSYYGKHGRLKALPDAVFIPSLGSRERCSVRVRRNDWVKRRSEIWRSYFDTFNLSSKEIVIMCSYFLPGWLFRKQMVKAAARGVRIIVILAGPSDVMLVKHAERFLYRWMFRNNIAVYEYPRDVLHAKIALRDDRFMTIGSYNLNSFSAYASVELNLEVRNRPFVSNVRRKIGHIITHECKKITPEYYRYNYSLPERWWQRCAYEIVKVLLYIFTFYLRQGKSSTQY